MTTIAIIIIRPFPWGYELHEIKTFLVLLANAWFWHIADAQ